MIDRPFQQTPGSGVSATAGAAAAITTLNKEDQQVVVTNFDSTDVAYVRIAATGDATAADFPIPPAKQVCLTKGYGATRISYYSAGTPDIHICTGNGYLNG
jgi:hypothetical protein